MMITVTQQNLLSQMKALESIANGGNIAMSSQEVGQNNTSFVDLLEQAISQVNETQQKASDLRERFEMGDPSVDIAEVMVAASQSTVSFEALLQVRNKFLTAYQDVMNMSV